MKKERLTVSDEQRERLLIAEQIERAAATSSELNKLDSSTPAEEGLKRSEGVQKVVLSFSAKPSTSEPQSSTDSRPAVGIGSLKMNPLKGTSSNPFKRANVFKTPAPTPAAGPSATADDTGKKRTISAAESLIYEEQERKRRKMERDDGM